MELALKTLEKVRLLARGDREGLGGGVGRLGMRLSSSLEWGGHSGGWLSLSCGDGSRTELCSYRDGRHGPGSFL